VEEYGSERALDLPWEKQLAREDAFPRHTQPNRDIAARDPVGSQEIVDEIRREIHPGNAA
jgi:hypothetical protein